MSADVFITSALLTFVSGLDGTSRPAADNRPAVLARDAS